MSPARLCAGLCLSGLLCLAAPATGGESARDFFSGRPSGMARAHNRVLDGSTDALIGLLRIPARFPDADASHRRDWRASLHAWWRDENKRLVLLDAYGRLSPDERMALGRWSCERDDEPPSGTAAQAGTACAAFSTH